MTRLFYKSVADGMIAICTKNGKVIKRVTTIEEARRICDAANK
jgi:hypothetical protein